VNDRERRILVEQATTAWRPRDADGRIRAHPAWHDLDAAGREDAHRATERLRALEAALDPDALSSTARAVLSAIRRAPGS
jgi:hypothetical protein